MGAALVAGNRVDLIHDHRLCRAENMPALFGGQQDVERFRRRNQDVRRAFDHEAALGGGRVARSHRDADLGKLQEKTFGFRETHDLLQRLAQIFFDVVAERF